jgi:hypothetical protein
MEQPPVSGDEDNQRPPPPRYARLWKAQLWESYRQIYAVPGQPNGDDGSTPGRTTGWSRQRALGIALVLVVAVVALVLLVRLLS